LPPNHQPERMCQQLRAVQLAPLGGVRKPILSRLAGLQHGFTVLNLASNLKAIPNRRKHNGRGQSLVDSPIQTCMALC
jgi:hypothetical protein